MSGERVYCTGRDRAVLLLFRSAADARRTAGALGVRLLVLSEAEVLSRWPVEKVNEPGCWVLMDETDGTPSFYVLESEVLQ